MGDRQPKELELMIAHSGAVCMTGEVEIPEIWII